MNIRSLFRRIIPGAALALAALAPAALGGSDSAAAAPPPTFGPMLVQAGGTEARIAFSTSEPTAVTVSHAPKEAPVGRQSSALAQSGGYLPVGGSGAAAFLPPVAPSGVPTQADWLYATSHEVKLTGLASNTAYTVTVNARTRDNRTATAQTSFTTAKKRVRLILDRINITDDGDWIGNGEPAWYWEVAWAGGKTGGCFPSTTPSGIEHLIGVCQAGSYGEGTHHPRNDSGEKLTLIFAEENLGGIPESFSLKTGAAEEDLIPLPEIQFFGFDSPAIAEAVWPVPRGKEWASTPITLDAHEFRGAGFAFRSTMDFRFELFHDNLPYPPNHGRAQVRANY